MTNEEIIASNVQIALYVGYKVDNTFPDKNRVYRLGNKIDMDSDFRYHESWDAIVPVVVKILLELDKLYWHTNVDEYTIQREVIKGAWCSVQIKRIWNEVVKGIQLINKLKDGNK